MSDPIARLRDAGVSVPERDVQVLRQAARDDAEFERFIEARARHQPVAQIIGRRAFWKHEFRVTPDVLDPRPDTETLVEAALSVPFKDVLDLGTGSGCILISLLCDRPEAHGLGIDISPKALDVARGNGARIGIDAQVQWTVSNWFSEVTGEYDLIVSNPPYIDAQSYAALDRTVREFEPERALTPGSDGLEAYRLISAQAHRYLRAGGWLMVEIGYDQKHAVMALFEDQEFDEISSRNDLSGNDRVVIGRLSR